MYSQIVDFDRQKKELQIAPLESCELKLKITTTL